MLVAAPSGTRSFGIAFNCSISFRITVCGEISEFATTTSVVSTTGTGSIDLTTSSFAGSESVQNVNDAKITANMIAAIAPDNTNICFGGMSFNISMSFEKISTAPPILPTDFVSRNLHGKLLPDFEFQSPNLVCCKLERVAGTETHRHSEPRAEIFDRLSDFEVFIGIDHIDREAHETHMHAGAIGEQQAVPGRQRFSAHQSEKSLQEIARHLNLNCRLADSEDTNIPLQWHQLPAMKIFVLIIAECMTHCNVIFSEIIHFLK